MKNKRERKRKKEREEEREKLGERMSMCECVFVSKKVRGIGYGQRGEK